MTTQTPTSTSSLPSPPPEPGRRRRGVVALIVVGAVVVVGAGVGMWVWWFRPTPPEPVVRFDQPIPADVETEARTAVASFVEVFDHRRECAGTASVVLVRDVEGGDARYVADGAVIEIEIPTTPERFRESLVHELAHHVEHSCPEFDELRTMWADRVGMAWSGQERWEDRLAEAWAETVVALVLGERLLHGDELPLDPALTELAVDWIDG